MDHEFWHKRWEENQIGFHQQEINQYLSSHWAELGLPDGAPVFVPLCGKSLDMLWLREQGHAVLGIELSDKALQDFFAENQLARDISQDERFTTYHTEGLRLLAGDFFALTRADLDGIVAVYDRASLIALPPQMRTRYARHLAELLPSGAHILLIVMDYAPGTIEGPPFSVSANELQELFHKDFVLDHKGDWVSQGPRGATVTESVYRLTRC